MYAEVAGNIIKIGSASFTGVAHENENNKPALYISINDKVTAFYITTEFRDDIPQMIPVLHNRYGLSLLSGDNDRQRERLEGIFGKSSELLFEQKPIDKLQYTEMLQKKGQKVLMMGDGLNDAGALQQAMWASHCR